MERSEQGASDSSSNDRDPRLDLLKQKYAQLAGHISSANQQCPTASHLSLSNVFNLIEGNYFYESLAEFGLNTRLNHFYTSLKTGDRFVAKVVSVFERSADVLLVWSPKRDIYDLKIKAYLRLVEQKRYSNGNRSSKYSRQDSSALLDKSIDVSELIFVELSYVNQSSRKIEVVRCKSLTDEGDAEDDEDDGLLNEDKYRPKSPSQTSFHDYMLDHDHLRNPSLVKQPLFTSLLYEGQVVDAYKRKLTVKEQNIQANKANSELEQNSNDEVILLDFVKGDQQNAAGEGPVSSGLHLNRSRSSELSKSKPHIESDKLDHKGSNYDNNKKRTHSLSSDQCSNSTRDDLKHTRSSSSSSSTSSSSDSESDSSSSSDQHRKKGKRKHKSSKSNQEKKRYKKRSKKHSKKAKKKKSKKSKDRPRVDARDSPPHRKKIDDKILKLLKFT